MNINVCPLEILKGQKKGFQNNSCCFSKAVFAFDWASSLAFIFSGLVQTMPQAMTNLILSNSIFSLLLSSNFEKLNFESLRFERIALQRYLYISFPFMLYRDQIQLCIVDQNNQMSTYFLCISKRKIAFLTRYEKIFTFELFKNVVPILGKIQPCCPTHLFQLSKTQKTSLKS